MSSLLNLTPELHQYILSNSVNEPKPLADLRKKTQALPQARMMTMPDQAQFLHFLLKLIQAKNVIEIGVFTGYSAAWMALAIPNDGRLIACDVEEKSTEIGKPFWKQLQVDKKIDLKIGKAEDTLNNLLSDKHHKLFDAVFIDADKTNYDLYYELSLALIRQGGLIIFDNLLWSGKVADTEITDPTTSSMRSLTKKLHADNRVDFSLLTIADGMGFALKK